MVQVIPIREAFSSLVRVALLVLHNGTLVEIARNDTKVGGPYTVTSPFSASNDMKVKHKCFKLYDQPSSTQRSLKLRRAFWQMIEAKQLVNRTYPTSRLEVTSNPLCLVQYGTRHRKNLAVRQFPDRLSCPSFQVLVWKWINPPRTRSRPGLDSYSHIDYSEI